MSVIEQKRVYLICPVRNCSEAQLRAMSFYVRALEDRGYHVHFPPRDVDQTNDDGGVRICREHRREMHRCDEVHIWWDDSSKGSHFDAGMAFMLQFLSSRVKVVVANGVPALPEKSFQNVVRYMAQGEDDGRAKH